MIIALILLAISIFAYMYFGLNEYLTFNNLKSNQSKLDLYYLQYPFMVLSLYTLIYIVSVAISFPGASILTIAAGTIFGLSNGLVIVSLSSTIGATIAFWSSRYFFKDFIEKQFKDKMKIINEGIKNEGAFYLFTLRIIPIFPFFIVNLLMGLTNIKTYQYFWISLIGMIPGTFIYVNAGTQLSKIDSIKSFFSLPVLVSLVLLGLLPLMSKSLMQWYKNKKKLKSLDKFSV